MDGWIGWMVIIGLRSMGAVHILRNTVWGGGVLHRVGLPNL